MKLTLPIIAAILLFSSCLSTHVNTMINEPAFTGSQQARIAVAAGGDHVEAQGSVSLTNHFGVVAGGYKGFAFDGEKGKRVFEGGINLFKKLDNHTNNTVSFSLTYITGKHHAIRGLNIPLLTHYRNYEVSTAYQGAGIQFAYCINRISRQKHNTIILLVKYEYLHFSNFDLEVYSSEGVRNIPYGVEMSARNKTAFQVRPALLYHTKNRHSPFYWQFQMGLNIMNGFTADKIEIIDGSLDFMEERAFRQMTHIKSFPAFLNIAFGMKLN